MSPPTERLPLATEIAPPETTSPCTSTVPLPEIEMALPGTPPHPAWFSAARAGVYSRLFTPPAAAPVSVGVTPFVRIRANCSCRFRTALSVNWLPAGPRLDTTCFSCVKSEYVHVTVTVDAPGVNHGEHIGAAYRNKFLPKLVLAACSASV